MRALQLSRPRADASNMRLRALAFTLLAALVLGGCATTGGRNAFAPERSHAERRKRLEITEVQTGTASYYARRLHGERTASGELHDEGELMAAHRTLPFGTRVRVTNLANDRSVVVVINDRGPYLKGRVLDVSRRAARELGFLERGITRVMLEVRP